MRKSLSIAIVTLLMVIGTIMVSHPVAYAATRSFTSNGATPTGRPWMGFGNNEYPLLRDSNNNNIAWTSSALNLTETRLNYIHPGITRINWYRDWFNPSGVVGNYTWSSFGDTNAFQILDYYKSQGYIVQMGLWHTLLNGQDSESFFTSTSFATLEADLMNEMVNVKGYSNIRYFASINELDCSYVGFTFSDWQTETNNLIAAFQSRGLSANLIVGPDAGCNPSWEVQAAQNNSSQVYAYGYHTYPSTVSDDSQETADSNEVNAVDGADSANKPVYLSEMGIGNPDTNPNITTYGYGLDMIDFGVQAARAGEASAMAWCVDGFDLSKNCGMWDISGQHESPNILRPWFYSWSLLNRYFPPGWTMETMAEPANMRIVGAHSPGASSANWSFALVNRDTANQQVITLQIPGWGSGLFNDYLYSQNNSPTDGNGFPVPVTSFYTASGGLAQGLTVTVPANSAVVLTSLDNSPLSKLSGGTSFSTSFVNGQPQPTWTNTIDTGPEQSAGNTANVGGICCGLTGAEAKPSTERAHTGSTSLLFSGMAQGGTSNYAYLKVFDLSGQNIVVDTNTQLTYWIYPQSPSDWNVIVSPNSTCVAIDIIFTDGTALRNLGATDQNGNRLHPAYQCGHLALDQWNQVMSTIGPVANGKTISKIDVGYDQPYGSGGARGYIDDISLNG